MTLELEALAYMLEQAPSLDCDTNFIAKVMRRVQEAPQHEDIPGVRFRASSIGKPWITQLLNAWYGQARTYTVSSCLNMMNGIIAEATTVELLTMCDYKCHLQNTLSIGVVAGHSDIIVEKGNTLMVLEVKSMAAHVISGFAANPNDDYGYLSQLSFYWGATRRDNPGKNVVAAFVLFDRSSSKYRVVPITPSAMERKLSRLDTAISQVTALKDYDVDELLELGAIPPCIGGKLPPSMKWSRWVNVLYRNTGDYWQEQDRDAIATQLKQLPLQRKDRA